MSLNREKLARIIVTSDFSQLIGEVENEWFECKSQPYQIQNDAGKRELAKDVSSFANIQGGYIFIGIRTKSSLTHFGDEVEKIRPFEQNLLNPNQYYDVIKSWVYPEIEDINIQWVSTKSNSKKGLIIIEVPNQRKPLKPFLIVRSLEGKKTREIMFGYAERKRDSSQPLSVVDLQKTLRSGFNYENQLKERFDGLEESLTQLTNKSIAITEKNKFEEKVNRRIEEILEHENMNQKRVLILTAYPSQPTELKTIFSTTEGSIRKHLEKPPTLRRSGWSLETLDQARITRGEMISVANGDRKIINLYRDGNLIFSGLADQKFLAWGDDSKKQKINPVAIVEIVYSFINFYKLVLEDFKWEQEKIFIRVDFRNMHLEGVKTYLVPYGIQPFEIEKKEAPNKKGTILRDFPVKDFNVGVVAFEVLKEIYLWFGLEEEKIPYIKTEGELKMVNPDEIRNIK